MVWDSVRATSNPGRMLSILRKNDPNSVNNQFSGRVFCAPCSENARKMHSKHVISVKKAMVLNIYPRMSNLHCLPDLQNCVFDENKNGKTTLFFVRKSFLFTKWFPNICRNIKFCDVFLKTHRICFQQPMGYERNSFCSSANVKAITSVHIFKFRTLWDVEKIEPRVQCNLLRKHNNTVSPSHNFQKC